MKSVAAGILLGVFTLIDLPAVGGLRAFYTFEGNAADVSGHGLDAVPGGGDAGPSFISDGYEGQAVNFDGTDYLTVPLDVNPSILPTMTWGAWVRVDDRTPNQQVLSQDNGGYDRSVGIDWRGGISGQFSAFTGIGVLGNGPAATLSNWFFLAVVYDDPSNSMALWVNDNKVTATSSFGSGWSTFRIGSNPSYGEFFRGSIDNVFVYDTALSDDEITRIRTYGAKAIQSQPYLTITNLGDGVSDEVRVSWSFATNVVLEQNSDLSTTNWVPSSYPVTVTNSTASITISPFLMRNLFFRLKVR